jgi:hypothetical protein
MQFKQTYISPFWVLPLIKFSSKLKFGHLLLVGDDILAPSDTIHLQAAEMAEKDSCS